MSTNKKMPAQPDEVGEVEEVNSSARVVAPAPSVEGRLNIQIQLQARDHIQFDVQFDVQILQSADGSYVFPMLNDIKTLLFVNIDKYLKETMQTAETSLRAALDSGGPYTQVTYIPRGGRSGASVTAGQPSVGHALLGRYGELLTEYLAREAARMCRYLLNRYTKPMGPMHMQPPAANEWFSRPTRRQLPEPRTDYQQYRQTFLDAASLPQPAPRQVLQQSQVRGPYGLFTTMNPDSEHNRILLPPLEPKHIGEQNPMAPGLVIKEHIPLSRVTREEAPIPVTLPPVARLIEQVEALEKGEEIDVLGSAFQTNNDNYAMSTDKDVEMKDAGAIDGDAPTHDGSTGSQAKLPGLSENFANDAFMQENVADQPHHPTGVKRAYDNYVTERMSP
ncbi:hypothetical protein F5Y06DRAFT_128436 [Hypoxylon sp. FL0890]|nr:hypothetical protein F5Y06DRAFT_128436 [Hypoxylon sp. FL0890]